MHFDDGSIDWSKLAIVECNKQALMAVLQSRIACLELRLLITKYNRASLDQKVHEWINAASRLLHGIYSPRIFLL